MLDTDRPTVGYSLYVRSLRILAVNASRLSDAGGELSLRITLPSERIAQVLRDECADQTGRVFVRAHQDWRTLRSARIQSWRCERVGECVSGLEVTLDVAARGEGEA